MNKEELLETWKAQSFHCCRSLRNDEESGWSSELEEYLARLLVAGAGHCMIDHNYQSYGTGQKAPMCLISLSDVLFSFFFCQL